MKKGIIVTMLIILILSIGSQAFALSGIGINPTPGVGQGVSAASKIIGVMQWCGYAIAAGVMVYIGIKYVTSSADDRASFKNAVWKYVFGAVLVTGATTIVGWIFK